MEQYKLTGSGEDVIIGNDVDIIKRIKINSLRWAGHVIRGENEEIIKRICL
jgi:hypothetical protein